MPEEALYEIRLKDSLDAKWAAYFAPFVLQNCQEGSMLVGVVHDQAELFGILLKLRDFGIRLISVKDVSDPLDAPKS
jgi:hypothetical protein